jgi:hypothetical protein
MKIQNNDALKKSWLPYFSIDNAHIMYNVHPNISIDHFDV